jgi:hypothetical protein
MYAGLTFAGAIPEDPLLNAVRLDEVQAALDAEVILGSNIQLDQEYDSVIVASQVCNSSSSAQLLSFVDVAQARPLRWLQAGMLACALIGAVVPHPAASAPRLQRLEELLEMLEEDQNRRPLIVTSMDRLDIVLGLLAAQVCCCCVACRHHCCCCRCCRHCCLLRCVQARAWRWPLHCWQQLHCWKQHRIMHHRHTAVMC